MNHKQNPNRSEKKTYLIPYIIIAILVVIAIILALFRGCEDNPILPPTDTSGNTENPGIVFDPGAVEGGWAEADTDKIIDSLNQKVEEGMMNISMNTTPNFANGTSEGNLMIVNETVNRYPQVVEITRNDTGEMIYKSGAIAVGSKIENAKLSVDLPAGNYECTALFYNVDPATGTYLGCAGAIIHINILE